MGAILWVVAAVVENYVRGASRWIDCQPLEELVGAVVGGSVLTPDAGSTCRHDLWRWSRKRHVAIAVIAAGEEEALAVWRSPCQFAGSRWRVRRLRHRNTVARFRMACDGAKVLPPSFEWPWRRSCRRPRRRRECHRCERSGEAFDGAGIVAGQTCVRADCRWRDQVCRRRWSAKKESRDFFRCEFSPTDVEVSGVRCAGVVGDDVGLVFERNFARGLLDTEMALVFPGFSAVERAADEMPLRVALCAQYFVVPSLSKAM